MALVADSLLERIQLKSQLTKWRVIAVVAIALLLISFFTPNESGVSDDFTFLSDVVARIEVADVITQDRERDKKIKALAKNDSVKAVILHIDSPGGTLVGGETLFYTIQALAGEKPVVVVMGNVAASGGYMAALPADYIVAHEGTITGSIGVIMQSAEFTEMAKKLGVNLLTFKSSDLKAAPSPFEKLTPKVRAAVMGNIRSAQKMFKRMVAESRNLSTDQVDKVADGRVFTGAQALEHQLIDAIGGEKQALAWLHEKQNIDKSLPVKDFSLKYKKSQFDEFYTRLFGGAGFSSILESTSGLMAIWRPYI